MDGVLTSLCSCLKILKHNAKLRACGIESCKGSLRLHIKKSPPSPPASPPSPGSIFLWQPLHLSIRSRVIAPCLNIYFVSVSVAGGCWRAFGSSGVGHLFVIATCGGTIVSTRCACCGLKFPFLSSLFRGLFLNIHNQFIFCRIACRIALSTSEYL